MFTLTDQAIEYHDPWATAREDRLAALGRGKRRVAYFYECPDNSTFRYRVYNMIQVLCSCDRGISATFFTGREIETLEQSLSRIDVLVICRSRYSNRLNRLICRAKSLGKRVLFDVDDLVFDADYIHLILNTLDQDLNDACIWDWWYAYVGRIAAALRMCDGVIVTNEYLASRVKEFVELPVSVIPNFLNEEQMRVSRSMFEEKQARQFARDGRLHLGYFSGTPTHNKDFEIISPVLAELLQNDPRLVVRIVGFLEIKGRLRDFKSRIEFYPLQDFITLQRLIGAVEVNLVPMQDNIFTNCKSELKYFEASIAGTVTVASPVFTLRSAIKDGKNGYLANSFQWHEKLQAVLDGMDSYAKMAQDAFSDSIKRYCWRNQAEAIERAVFE